MLISSPEKSFTSISLINLIKKYRRLLIIVALLALIVGTVTALMIRNTYRATVIIYPSKYSSTSAIILNQWTARDIFQFGEDEDAERLIQLLQSDSLREHVSAKFKLPEHYGIQPDDKKAKQKLLDTYLDNVRVKRTDLLSVRVDVVDEDPQMAARMANEIADYTDTIKSSVLHALGTQAYKAVESVYLDKKEAVKKLSDSLNNLKGNQGPVYFALSEMLKFSMKDLNDLETSYYRAKADMTSPMTAMFIVNHAQVPQVKYQPMRSFIVLLTLASSIFFTLVILLIYEQGRATEE